MAKISESVCLNHPDTPAVTRCATCSKPICKQCIVSKNGSSYCRRLRGPGRSGSGKQEKSRCQSTQKNRDRRDHSSCRCRRCVLLLLAEQRGSQPDGQKDRTHDQQNSQRYQEVNRKQTAFQFHLQTGTRRHGQVTGISGTGQTLTVPLNTSGMSRTVSFNHILHIKHLLKPPIRTGILSP